MKVEQAKQIASNAVMHRTERRSNTTKRIRETEAEAVAFVDRRL